MHVLVGIHKCATVTDVKKKTIAIVGAGPGGLATGMILAHRGYHVTIFEKADRVGGRSAKLTLGEYSFDTGPTFLLMKPVLDRIFQQAGRASNRYLQFTELDPLYNVHFQDKQLAITTNAEQMAERIASLFPGQEQGYRKFMRVEARRFSRMAPLLLQDFSSRKAFMRKAMVSAAPLLPSLFRSVDDQLKRYFSNEELRVAFAFQSKYLGMSSWAAPSIFTSLSYMEHAYGLYHVEGGLNQISTAMAKVIKEEGGVIHLSAPVQQIVVRNGRAVGVQVAGVPGIKDSVERLFDEVIVNADFAYAAKHLFPEGTLPSYSPQWVDNQDQSCSTFMIYLGLDKQYAQLAHHNLYMAPDYAAHSKAILEDGVIPEGNLLFYLHNPSLIDHTLAPAGHSALYALAPVPNTTSGINWNEYRTTMRQQLLEAMKQRAGLYDIEHHIVEEQVTTPANWEAHYNVEFGALFSFAHTIPQMLYNRPHNKLSDIDHAYIVGGGTHPGSGLATIYSSGYIVANMISRHDGIPYETMNTDFL